MSVEFNQKYMAVDPMALLLSSAAYLIWVEIHHPHEPAIQKVVEVIKTLNAEEKKFALARAKSMVAYGKAVEEALEGEHCRGD